MESKALTSKEYFTILTIIHAALLFGQIVILLVFFFLVSSGEVATDEGLNDILQVIAPAFIIGGIIVSYVLTQNKLKTIKEKSSLQEKLAEYRTLLIIKYAILEVPSLFALICFYLTGNFIFLGLAGIIILYFAILRPTRYKVITELELSRDERDQIENSNSIIT